ncbi:MAG: cation diffusion facilitator family transporter [Clostridiaceae bacterium]|jgi:cation diffusion facilitator family transporter|nr:cation diffusion facilitator family transporter [Clostridiaceae bacterium]
MKDIRARNKQTIIAAAIGIAVNILLFALKVYIGLSANSISILYDGINNLLDCFSFGIVILSFVLMNRKPTEKLPFGFGRMEYIAGFFMSVIILVTGGIFAFSALERIAFPFLLTFTWLNFGLIASSVVVKLALAVYFRHVNTRVNSGVIKGAQIDSITDAGLTLMTLIGFSLTRYAGLRLDGIIGLVISAAVITEGLKLLVGNAASILGKRIDKATEEGILAIVARYGVIKEARSVKLHDYGAGREEIVLELLFTSGNDFDIINKVIDGIVREAEAKYGKPLKICVMPDTDTAENEIVGNDEG